MKSYLGTDRLDDESDLVSDTAYDATTWNGQGAVAPSKNTVRDQVELLAPKASPTFTGTPAGPTAAQGTNTTQLATTAMVQSETALLVPRTVVGPELLRKTTANAKDDEFLTSSLDGSWTRVDYANSGAVTYNPNYGMLSVKHTGGDAAQGWHALLKSMSGLSAPVTIETCLRLQTYEGTLIAGLVITDGTTVGSGKQVSLDHQRSGATSFRNWTGFNAFGGELTGSPTGTGPGHRSDRLFMRLTWVSANTWRAEVSPDGISWMPFNFTNGLADSSHTMTPTHMGIWLSSYGTGANLGGIFTFEHFRVTA